MGQVSKYFAISRFFSWKTSLPHPRTATRSSRALISFRIAAVS